MGYDDQSPTYLIYFQDSQAVKKIRCVKFIENISSVAELSSTEQMSAEDDILMDTKL